MIAETGKTRKLVSWEFDVPL